MKLSSRSYAVAEAIRDRVDFTTHGALKGGKSLRHHGSGRLNERERQAWDRDYPDIDYAVFSYVTPIAWHTPSGWHVVDQKFTNTTSKHQAKLYLI